MYLLVVKRGLRGKIELDRSKETKFHSNKEKFCEKGSSVMPFKSFQNFVVVSDNTVIYPGPGLRRSPSCPRQRLRKIKLSQ